MRATIVAGIGGLILGHVLWLVAIWCATRTSTVNAWVLAIGAACVLLAAVGGLLGWVTYLRRASAKAAFLWCLPVAPLFLSLCVLGVTYL